ncbi:unnamed protein product [Chondrus crispus]|uniref:Uncharacterized protein n=1 Tax=Chondrus crispus TaxID=2769 RepID=R7QP13_CHOCR|nr:unnamed protein product [Chondrus crispus]CDF40242.1 unnamed protein product [Chondrus crispus]|eukprot:XP_005710536.1 unnamed protein product [Chondrus crispus]
MLENASTSIKHLFATLTGSRASTFHSMCRFGLTNDTITRPVSLSDNFDVKIAASASNFTFAYALPTPLQRLLIKLPIRPGGNASTNSVTNRSSDSPEARRHRSHLPAFGNKAGIANNSSWSAGMSSYP